MRGARMLPAAALLIAAACGRVIAPPPPTSEPDTQLVGMVAGEPIMVAPRAARRLQDMGFTTKRFSSDSLWGARSQDQLATRMRYTSPGNDSTRVLIEVWGPCQRKGCRRQDAMAILQALQIEEGPPQ